MSKPRDVQTVHRDLLETNLLHAYRLIAELTAQVEALQQTLAQPRSVPSAATTTPTDEPPR